MIIQLKADDMRGQRPPVEPIPGTWIAGGAIRRWFTGKEELSDVDVFRMNEGCIKEFIANTPGLRQIDDHRNATTYLFENSVRVQTMKLYRESMETLLDSFDYNVCQFCWQEDGIFATQEAVIGTLRGHLAVATISPEYAVDSLRRAFKYHSRGFAPCNGTIKDIADALAGLTPEQIQRQATISPHGGNFILRYD